jgi:hypothetical protein
VVTSVNPWYSEWEHAISYSILLVWSDYSVVMRGPFLLPCLAHQLLLWLNHIINISCSSFMFALLPLFLTSACAVIQQLSSQPKAKEVPTPMIRFSSEHLVPMVHQSSLRSIHSLDHSKRNHCVIEDKHLPNKDNEREIKRLQKKLYEQQALVAEPKEDKLWRDACTVDYYVAFMQGSY